MVFTAVLPRRSNSALTENIKKAERGKVLQNSIGKLYLHMRVLIILGSFSGAWVADKKFSILGYSFAESLIMTLHGWFWRQNHP